MATDDEKPRIPWLVPLFPLGPLDPDSRCGHKGRIKRGSSFVCVICFQSGWEGHPDLEITAEDMTALAQYNPRDAWRADYDAKSADRPAPPPTPTRPPVKLTRKQRRSMMFVHEMEKPLGPPDAECTAPDSSVAELGY